MHENPMQTCLYNCVGELSNYTVHAYDQYQTDLQAFMNLNGLFSVLSQYYLVAKLHEAVLLQIITSIRKKL